jgi:hypothetical protein
VNWGAGEIPSCGASLISIRTMRAAKVPSTDYRSHHRLNAIHSFRECKETHLMRSLMYMFHRLLWVKWEFPKRITHWRRLMPWEINVAFEKCKWALLVENYWSGFVLESLVLLFRVCWEQSSLIKGNLSVSEKFFWTNWTHRFSFWTGCMPGWRHHKWCRCDDLHNRWNRK